MVSSNRQRRGFSLVEAIAAMVIISITAPTAMVYLNDAARNRIDAAQSTRAAWLAQTILEECAADAASSDPIINFDAMANAAQYRTSLASRLASDITDQYAKYGMSWSITTQPVVVAPVAGGHRATAQPGLADPDFRQIEVTVQWRSASVGDRSITVECVVARP